MADKSHNEQKESKRDFDNGMTETRGRSPRLQVLTAQVYGEAKMTGTNRSKTILAMLVIGLVLTAGQVTAERATSLEMAQAAQNFVAEQIAENGAWAGPSDAKLTRVQEITVDGEVLGRCYSFSPGGFVIVPVLKEMGPIKLYSEHGDLDVNASDGMADLVRTALATHAEEYIKVYGSLDTPQSTAGDKMHFAPADRQAFDRLAVNPRQFSDRLLKGSSDTRDTTVPPLLDVHWHQQEPFNTYCPVGTPVGCVATAFAQVMQYWNWPAEGAGSSGYWWDGDGGPNEYLTAEYWDSYDWANIPDYCPYPACSTAAQDSGVAELNYEVAVAFEMDFGADGSGLTWSEILGTAMPAMVDNFLYKSTWDAEYRNVGHTGSTWFAMIQDEINAERPIPYGIWGHMIVCDGWKIDQGLNYYHMNYGWNDGHNAWYRVDELYYPDEENHYLYDQAIRFLEPDQSVMFSTEDRLGWVPFDAFFEGGSELSADAYDWNFGDGGTADGDTCTHTYTEAGVYDVSLAVTSGGTPYSRTKEKYVIALADSLYADTILVDPGADGVDVQIHATNTISLNKMTIPVEFGGDVELDPNTATWSTDGLRSSVFDQVDRVQFDPMNNRMTFVLRNTGAGSDLSPGSGPVLEMSFEYSSQPVTGDSTQIKLDGYAGRVPTFAGSLASYEAVAMDGLLHLSSCCQGIRGNVDGDPAEQINIADLLYLVTYMFEGGTEPPCMKEANVDGDIFENVDISDLLYLVTYMFEGGPAPVICF